jgi:hypothetical protein
VPKPDEEIEVLAGTAEGYRRVAEEAMRLMTPAQITQLRHRLDDLEAGDGADDGGDGGGHSLRAAG